MKRSYWIALAAALLGLGSQAAIASAGTDGPAPALGYDISNPPMLPANATCGHTARYNYSSVQVDWAVNGVVVAYDTYGINHTNDGSPYTLSIGQVSGGTLNVYHSETFYPQADDDFASCRSM